MEPIKSFIYYKPIKDTKEIIEKIEISVVKDQKKKAQEEKSPTIKEVKLADKETTPKEPQNVPKVQSEQTTILTKTTVPPLKYTQKKPIKNYTGLRSLSRLKDKINKQIIDQEMYNYYKPNTGSVMLGTPNYIPHSFVENTEKKTIASTASQVGNGFSITKNDNGVCTLTEDLSAIGLQGKTTSGFKCGLSKDEEAFKNHMKKVLKNLGK